MNHAVSVVAGEVGNPRLHADHRQAVPLAHGVVVGVVRRGPLHDAGAEFAVDVSIGDVRWSRVHYHRVSIPSGSDSRSLSGRCPTDIISVSVVKNLSLTHQKMSLKRRPTFIKAANYSTLLN